MAKKRKTQEVIQKEHNDMDLLEFRVGPYTFCAPANDVEAIIQPPAITPVPLSSDLVAGCFIHQDRTVTVLCLNTKLGIPVDSHSDRNESHIILSEVDDGLKGFWVDIARNISVSGSFDIVPDYYPHELKAYDGFLLHNDDIMLQTTFERLYRCARSRMYWRDYLHSFNNTRQLSETAHTVLSDKVDEVESVRMATRQNANESCTPSTMQHSDNVHNNQYDAANSSEHTSLDDNETELTSPALVANADFINGSPSDTNKNHGTSCDSSGSDKLITSNRIKQYSSTGETSVAGNIRHGFITSRPATAGGNTVSANQSNSSASGSGRQATKNHNTGAAADKMRHAAAHAYRQSRTLHDANVSALTGPGSNHAAAVSRGPVHRQHEITDTTITTQRSDRSDAANNKKSLLPLLATLLALAAVGLGTAYMMQDETRPVTARKPRVVTPDKPEVHTSRPVDSATVFGNSNVETGISGQTDIADTIPESNAADSTYDTANHISTASSGPDTLNETELPVSQTEKTTGRVIELSVTEPEIVQPEVSARTYQHYTLPGSAAREFTHVVKKGDTLWHITKRYLGNPFRYPELAQSSHIRNPHLIYPGDIIRISIRQKHAK